MRSDLWRRMRGQMKNRAANFCFRVWYGHEHLSVVVGRKMCQKPEKCCSKIYVQTHSCIMPTHSNANINNGSATIYHSASLGKHKNVLFGRLSRRLMRRCYEPTTHTRGRKKGFMGVGMRSQMES